MWVLEFEWSGETYLILDVLVLRRIDVHLIGFSCFVGGRINVHVDILGLLRHGSIVTAVSESARLHHVHSRHDACVDCIGRVDVHRHVLSGKGVHVVFGMIGSTVLFGMSAMRRN